MNVKNTEQSTGRAYKVNSHPRSLKLQEAMLIVNNGVSSLFDPTEKEAIALCVCTLYKKCFEANKRHRAGKQSGYTDDEYDAMERSLMVYCSDFESLK